MATKRITFHIQGLEKDNGDVQLDDFIKQLSLIKQSLNEVDKTLSETHQETVYFRVVNLSHSSPARVELEEVPIDQNIIVTETVIDRYYYGISQIFNQGDAPVEFDYDVLQAFSNLTGLIGKSIAGLTISMNGSSLPITNSISSVVNEILGDEYFEDGSITGMLDHLNLHIYPHIFSVYPTFGDGKLRCSFRRNLRPLVLRAVGQYITVTGRKKYRSRSSKPYEMDVETIEIHSSAQDLPTLSELRGIAPDALEGKTTEEFLWDIRNEWD